MDQIVPAFETTLFDPTLSDVCLDVVELGIDTLLSNEMARSIPIVGLLVGAGKTAQNIHDRNLVRQTVKFINAFNEKKISSDKIEKYRKKLKKHPKFAEEELGRVIILLNSNVDLKKSELLAKFYRAYVSESIDWGVFCELADITSRLFISDLRLLYDIYQHKITDTSQCYGYQVERLISLGVLDSAIKSMQVSNRPSGSYTQRHVQVNSLGELYCSLSID